MRVGVFAAALVQAAFAKSSGKGLEVFDGYNVDMKWNSKTEEIEYTVVAPDNTVFGFVLGGHTMFDANLIGCVSNGGSSFFGDLWSTGEYLPTPVTTSSLVGGFEQKDGEVIFKFTRPLDPGDDEHYVQELDVETRFGFIAQTQSADYTMQHDITSLLELVITSDGQGFSGAIQMMSTGCVAFASVVYAMF